MVQTYFTLAKLVQKTMFFGTRLLKNPLFYKENNGTKTCHQIFSSKLSVSPTLIPIIFPLTFIYNSLWEKCKEEI